MRLTFIFYIEFRFCFRYLSHFFSIDNLFIILSLQADLIYENGVKVDVKKMKILDTIPSSPAGDRLFINSLFFIIFSEKYILKQMKKGMDREKVLAKFRGSNRHQVMKGSLASSHFSS